MYVSYLVLIRFAFIIAERFVNNLICIVRVRAHTITSLLLLNLSMYIAAAAEGEGLGQSEHANPVSASRPSPVKTSLWCWRPGLYTIRYRNNLNECGCKNSASSSSTFGDGENSRAGPSNSK